MRKNKGEYIKKKERIYKKKERIYKKEKKKRNTRSKYFFKNPNSCK